MIARAHSITNDEGTGSLGRRHSTVIIEEACTPPPLSWRKLLRYAGPGLLMCIAYVDPGNLESDLQTGAGTGYSLLWLLALTTIMGFIVQMQAARLGVATGKNLAELCRTHYPRGASLVLWVMAEVAIIGSDVQEVIGSALALTILSKGALPLWAAAVLSAAASFVMLLVERAGVRFLEAVFGVFIMAMIAAFGYLFAVADVPMREVARGFLVPELPREALPTAVALFGSLIMPHNIYLHSALVQSRGLAGTTTAVKKDALVYFGIESGLSLVAALFINMFVVCVFASGFHSTGADPPDIGLRNAGEYLGAQYGPVMVIVWGLGLLAAGQSSTMTGTYTGQFVMSGFLNLKVSPWARIIITRSVALVPTLAVTLSMDPDSNSLDKLNQALNLLQSIQLPFALIPVLTFTGSVGLMGSLATSGLLLAACWTVAVVVICVNMTAVAQVASAWTASTEAGWIWDLMPVAVLVGIVLYFGFLLFLVASSPDSCIPALWNRRHKKRPVAAAGLPVQADECHREGGSDDPLILLQQPLLLPAPGSMVSPFSNHNEKVAAPGRGTGSAGVGKCSSGVHVAADQAPVSARLVPVRASNGVAPSAPGAGSGDQAHGGIHVPPPRQDQG